MNSIFRRGLLAGGFATALSLSLLAPVLAQQNTPQAPAKHRQGMHTRKHHRASMVKDLNLTEDQKAKLKAAREAFRQRVTELRGNTGLTPEQKKEQFQAARTEFRQSMQSVLTPEQREKVEAARAQAKTQRGNKPHGGKMMHRRGARGAWLQDLNLTAEQKEKMSAAQSAFRTRAQEIRGMNVEQDQKKTLFKEAATAFRTQVNSILTPEQKQKLEAKREQALKHRRGPAAAQRS